MGAIERSGFRFEPEFSVINQDGAIHVYHNGNFVEEILFEFSGSFPEHDQIEALVDEYCHKNQID
ncbi:YbxH family protein [Bacillus sp. 31A1R]|uniref:YbxH family protein n=1 Tax=Robertmurraya mangrovi TaxID=3098077 RepID=A0ABU5J3C1_9BACI|nr:YbxH family protein [Bacillus sp. 31A1R]MDZ5473852.1 YbxH family protein [Bacillus sp. 31A1R]